MARRDPCDCEPGSGKQWHKVQPRLLGLYPPCIYEPLTRKQWSMQTLRSAQLA